MLAGYWIFVPKSGTSNVRQSSGLCSRKRASALETSARSANKLHDLAGTFALAVEIGFINDVQFAAPLVPGRVIELEFQSRDAGERGPPVVRNLFPVSKHRVSDELVRGRAHELRFISEMCQHRSMSRRFQAAIQVSAKSIIDS